MAAIGKPSQPNLPRLVSKWVPEIGFGVNSFNSKFEPCSSSNDWDIFSLIFGHQGGNGTTFKWSIMSGRLIWLFRNLECQNPSIISESIGIPNGSEKIGKKK